jgi:transposase
VPASPVVAPDDTGWRVGGIRSWLWAFVSEGVTVYRVAHGRGYADAAAVLGERYAGVIQRDGWAPYRRFQNATHQSCPAHLLRRWRELLACYAHPARPWPTSPSRGADQVSDTRETH